MIDPRDFTNEMEKYWSEKLGNVSSEALRIVLGVDLGGTVFVFQKASLLYVSLV